MASTSPRKRSRTAPPSTSDGAAADGLFDSCFLSFPPFCDGDDGAMLTRQPNANGKAAAAATEGSVFDVRYNKHNNDAPAARQVSNGTNGSNGGKSTSSNSSNTTVASTRSSDNSINSNCSSADNGDATTSTATKTTTTTTATTTTSMLFPAFFSKRVTETGKTGNAHEDGDNGNAKSPEDILASDMNRINLYERQNAYEDIHGVSSPHEEVEERLQDCMSRLRKEIQRLPNKQYYNKAAFLNPRYVNDRNFQLMFLRAEQFDVIKAAARLASHFEKKFALFGVELLAKPIRWEDLQQDARDAISNSPVSLLPTITDSSGRMIAMFFTGYCTVMRGLVAPKSHTQGFWYMLMSAISQSPESQRKGIVLLVYTHGATAQLYLKSINSFTRTNWLWDSVPTRISAAHLCLKNRIFQPLTSSLLMLVTKHVRVRLRLHYGAHMEVQYELESFGIPRSVLLIDADGNLRHDRRSQHLKQLVAVETERDSHQEAADRQHHDDGCILVPKESDILLGKGYPTQTHAGNVELQTLIQSIEERHREANKTTKTTITNQIIHDIKSNGGRFLQQQEDGIWWKEVDDGKARSKVAMAFRNLQRATSKSKKKSKRERQ